MTSYYPSQAGYSTTQPVMYGQPSYQGTAYAPSAGVMGVPVAQAAPVMMQPSMAGYQPGFDPRQLTFGQRMRLFFGLAPTPAFKYRSDKNWWGFMGYSRRQRFIDPRTGGEVDRNGRPVIRV